MFKLIYTNSFEKDIKIAIKRSKDLRKLKRLIELLSTKSPLPVKYRDHKLMSLFGDKKSLAFRRREDIMKLPQQRIYKEI